MTDRGNGESPLNDTERYGHRFNARLVAQRVATMDKQVIHVLDAGCGKGQLMASIVTWVPRMTNKKIHVYGFDVSEHGAKEREKFEAGVQALGEAFPSIDWEERVKVVSEDEPWPFESDMFDIVVSNQVLEHVRDLDAFIKEHRRVMDINGTGLHCFPTKHVVNEQHVCVPWAHRIAAEKRRAKWLRMAYALGVGRQDKLRECKRSERWRVAQEQAKYVSGFTHYRSMREFEKTVRDHGMVCSYEYTPQFYADKLREQWSADGRVALREMPIAPAFMGKLLATVLRYLASVVVHIRNPRIPQNGGLI